ncbi:hypothetical protein L873DRAFT_1686024 [Choiromyces venosus 120613-1]|uniref:Uncharacterized protein n=1 Tax=Choiromyces venosus 120613-1 TaxID=1336337 RepID=A0A3N4JZ12_9PEZI|nr:hypothetical protein L873DRAFT_1686024 [Choiromyces venosus 120613-1]
MYSHHRPNRRGKPPEAAIITQYKNFIKNSQRDENGNRFLEAIIPMATGDWTRINRRRPTLHPRPPEIFDGDVPTTGVQSLHILTRRVLNKNIEEFPFESLKSIPWLIMKPVWGDVLVTSRDSFRVWSAFASAYGDEPGFLCHSRTLNDGPTMERLRIEKLAYTISIGSLIGPISNDQGMWIVYLNLLYSKGYTRDELLCIPEIPNLVVLNFPYTSNGQVSTLDDGVIRSWSRSASRDGKLSKLKILILRNHPSITNESPKYLSWIKSLEIVELTDTLITNHAPYWNVHWEHDTSELWKELSTTAGIVRAFRKQQPESEKSILILQIGDYVIRSSGEHRHNIFILKRIENSTVKQAKRKGPSAGSSNSSNPPSSPPGPAKKRKGVRDSKKKDIGNLLVEFGCGRGGGEGASA